MKKIQITTFSDVPPTINETVANGYALGQWWQVNETGDKYYHKTDGVWINIDTSPKYKVYRALLTQGGENNPPVAIIFENTLESEISYTYTAEGVYKIRSSLPIFYADKLFIYFGSNRSTNNSSIQTDVFSETEITLTTMRNDTGIPTNEVLYKTAIEIQIYN